MDKQTAKTLCEINNDFYRNHSESFSATRRAPWAGWEKCASYISSALPHIADPETSPYIASSEAFLQVAAPETAALETLPHGVVLDAACGNMRFERFLVDALPDRDFVVYAIDDCAALVNAAPRTVAIDRDIIAALIDERDPFGSNVPSCDVAVSFGFMHHVPGARMRYALLANLVRHTRSGGIVIVSLWRFMNDAGLARRATETTAQAFGGVERSWRTEDMRAASSRFCHLRSGDLEEGDYLLGWKNEPGAYRYCHHFSDGDVDDLVDSVSARARVLKRFDADGRTGALNAYIVLQVE